MQPPTTIHNHPQPPTTIRSNPQPPTTIHNYRQSSTTTYNHLQPPTTTHKTTQNHPEPPITTHSRPQPPKTIYNYPQPPQKLPSTIHNHPEVTPKNSKLVTNSYVTALKMLILKQTLALIVIWNNGIYTCVCVSVCIYFISHYIYYFLVKVIVSFCQH